MIEGKVFCQGTVINDANTNITFEPTLEDSEYAAGLAQKVADSISVMGDPRAKIFTQDRPCDPVTRPSHYTQGPMEIIDIIEQYGFVDDFRLGNCVKYLFRHRLKGAPLQDLKKARWYLDRLIASMEAPKP